MSKTFSDFFFLEFNLISTKEAERLLLRTRGSYNEHDGKPSLYWHTNYGDRQLPVWYLVLRTLIT